MKILDNKNSKQISTWLILKLVCFVVFVSCAPTSDRSSNLNNSGISNCEYLYEEVFTLHFHNFVRTLPRACIGCHSDPGISHQFALPDANLSFQNFLLMSSVPAGSGRATDAKNQLRASALDISHGTTGGAGDPAYLAELDSFEPDWIALEADYNSCISSF